MLTIQTYTPDMLPVAFADQMASRLTKPGSEHHQWLSGIASGKQGGFPDDLVYVVASMSTVDDELQVVGWASCHYWHEHNCMQCFVDEGHRGNKLATAICAVLFLAFNIPKQEIAVFSPESIRIAEKIGCQKIAAYKRVEDGWIRYEWIRPRGT